MNLGEKLRKLIEDKGITRAELSRQTGLPYTTIDSILRRSDFDKVKLSTLQAIKNYFHVSLDYLIVDDSEEIKGIAESKTFSLSAYETAVAYDQEKDPDRRNMARLALGLEKEKPKDKPEPPVNVILCPPLEDA